MTRLKRQRFFQVVSYAHYFLKHAPVAKMMVFLIQKTVAIRTQPQANMAESLAGHRFAKTVFLPLFSTGSL